MKIYLLLLFLPLLIVSCSPLKKISKRDIYPLSVGNQVVVQNAMISNDAKLKINLLSFFKQSIANVKYCTLKVESPTTLLLTYIDSASISSDKMVKHRFEGKLLKTGVFEIYHMKKRIEIPPLIPILYSNVSIRRIRIGLLATDKLAVEYKYVNTGSWFILAAGGSSRDTYFFNVK